MSDILNAQGKSFRAVDSLWGAEGSSYHPGRRLPHRFQTHDGRTADSTGAFIIGELERLDQTYHGPLSGVTWGRDLSLRTDVTMADEYHSYTLSNFGSQGGLGTGNGIGTGKSWVGKNTTEISGVSLDISKITHQLRGWGLDLKYTVFELESAARLGRPVDQQKYEAIQRKYQMDIDEQVYIGDISLGDKGLLNNASVTPSSLPNNLAGSSTRWAGKTADEILLDTNLMLNATWASSAYQVVPEVLLLPPTTFGYISTQKVSSAGNISILRYIQENSLLASSGKGPLKVYPLKWCLGTGAGGTIGTDGNANRAVVYTNDPMYARYAMTPLQRTPVQFAGLYHSTTYYGRLGSTEIIYPETIGYFDGI